MKGGISTSDGCGEERVFGTCEDGGSLSREVY